MKTNIIPIFLSLLVIILLMGCSNSSTHYSQTTPESTAEAMWLCIGSQAKNCYYDLSSNEIQQQCDAEDSGCAQTQQNLYGVTVLTRGKEVFEAGNYKIEVKMMSDTEAQAEIFAPVNTSWPNKMTLIKEDGVWKNKKIMLS